MLRYALEGDGAFVTVAASAEQAVTIFQHIRPTVLVTGFSMPGGDGYELLRILRTILVTALPPHEHRDRARLAGFAAFLPKPIDFEMLCAMILNVALGGVSQ